MNPLRSFVIRELPESYSICVMTDAKAGREGHARLTIWPKFTSSLVSELGILAQVA